MFSVISALQIRYITDEVTLQPCFIADSPRSLSREVRDGYRGRTTITITGYPALIDDLSTVTVTAGSFTLVCTVPSNSSCAFRVSGKATKSIKTKRITLFIRDIQGISPVEIRSLLRGKNTFSAQDSMFLSEVIWKNCKLLYFISSIDFVSVELQRLCR